jgi:hypothetical protein
MLRRNLADAAESSVEFRPAASASSTVMIRRGTRLAVEPDAFTGRSPAGTGRDDCQSDLARMAAWSARRYIHNKTREVTIVSARATNAMKSHSPCPRLEGIPISYAVFSPINEALTEHHDPKTKLKVDRGRQDHFSKLTTRRDNCR